MIDLLKEFDCVIRAFHEKHIRYAIIGGLAVAIYGGIRATRDMDFLIHPEDLAQAGEALRKVGYQASEPWTFQKTGLTLHRWWKARGEDEDLSLVDLLESHSTEYLSMIERAVAEEWREGIILPVACRADLIKLKEERGSHTDLADIEFLTGKKDSDEKPGIP